jgi:hypothetical protein
MADGRQVDADLMGAARHGLSFDQGVFAGSRSHLMRIALEHVILGDGFAPTPENRHTLPVVWVPAYGSLDSAPRGLEMTIQERQVAFSNLALFELVLE